MKISSLLTGPTPSPSPCSCVAVHDLDQVYQERLENAGFKFTEKVDGKKRSLANYWISSEAVPSTSLHFKVVSRHGPSNCYRCNLSSGKTGCPVSSDQLSSQMRMVSVFFRRGDEDNTVLSQFLLFPSWLLHVFRYSQHGNIPGRCDVRFLEDATTAKEDQVFRFNNVINILFRFDIDHIDRSQVEAVIGLSNHLADIRLDRPLLPPPRMAPHAVHHLYADLVELLGQQRPIKLKPACINCASKPSSRRTLCVACYRYQLKHNQARPMRLIVANRAGPKIPPILHNKCTNCSVEKTHQWYRNVLGKGHWCETCKSYYVRHKMVRPRDLFVRAAKRKADFRKVIPK